MKKRKKVKKARKVNKPRKAKRIKKVTRPKKVKKVKKIRKIPRPKRVKVPEKPKEIEKAPKAEIVEKPTPKVPYTIENASLCMCTKCPVQVQSACAKEKMEKIQAMMQAGAMPSAEDLPGLYCSTGAAACKDLDTSKMCACTSCPVWAKFNLAAGKPMGYFCRDGKAE